MQSLDEPDLFKVGFTKRLTNSRRNELKGKVGGRLKVYYTLSMPNAYFTEQRVLRDLRARWFGRGDRRGTEWFRLRRNETLPDIAARIFKAAGMVRRVSKLKLSWPKGQEYVIYSCNELAVLDDKGKDRLGIGKEGEKNGCGGSVREVKARAEGAPEGH